MKRAIAWMCAAWAAVVLSAPLAHADDQADHLRDLAKQAHAKGAFDQEADDLCQAAALDPQKYSKKCARARDEAGRQLKEFEGYLGTGRFELQQKDYQGAIRDLSKIRFGPLIPQAQTLIAQAKAGLLQPAVDAASAKALHLAFTAYQQGDFATAAAQAAQVRSPNLQPQANQILTNIRVYQDTMSQADALLKNSDYKGAEQKYTFAVNIRSNGPGNPGQKLQKVQAILQKQTQEQQAAAAEAEKPAPPKVDYAARVKSDLAEAQSDEAKGDLKGALHAFNEALALDGRQAEAVAGRKRMIAAMHRNRKDLEESLAQGIRSYYASDFDQANDALNLFLSGSDPRGQGAAHFYLAASLLSQAILADPQDETQAQSLRQNAEQQFQLARQAHYKPVEKLVSPKVLEEWARTGSQP